MTEWWEREDLHFQDGVLMFAGRRVDDLAAQFGTPTFFYNSQRIVANAERLRSALHGA